MSALASRKRLLIAESEINRAELLQECQALAGGLGDLAGRAKALNSLVAVVLPLAAAAGWLAKRRRAPEAASSTWLQKLAVVGRLGSSLWGLFRSGGADPEARRP